MKIIENGEQISFEAFSQRFPVQAEILKDYNGNFSLELTSCGLAISTEKFEPLSFELDKKIAYHERFFYKNSIYKDPLAKALGIKKGKEKPSVIDATGGSLSDSSLIISYGVENLLIYERNPLIAALSSYEIEKLGKDTIKFRYGQLEFDKLLSYDVVYFDPMYQEKNTKTAPKKEMAIFRELVGVDLDAKSFAINILEKVKNRLVIKRSKKANPLIDGPSMSIVAKSTCYDVYLGRK